MKYGIITAFLLIVINCAGFAQNDQALYFMNLPQRHLLNPALRSTNPTYVGLPALSGIKINVTNNYFNFSDVFTEGVEVSKYTLAFLDPGFDRERFINNLKRLNSFNPRASVQLLGAGFTTPDNYYLFIDVVDHADINIVGPEDFISMAFMGNEEYEGQTLDLSDSRMDINYFREIGFGVSKNLNPRFRFGAKARLLFGLAGATFQNYHMNLTVNDDYTNTLDANMSLDVSGPVTFYTASDSTITDVKLNSNIDYLHFFTNMQNMGFGIDLGAEYIVNDYFVVSAALTDVGFIKWKSDLSNLESFGTTELRGLDFEDIYEGRATIDDLYNSMKDSLRNAFILAGTDKRFTMKLPVGLTIAGSYILNEKYSFGLLSSSRLVGSHFREAITLSANMNVGNRVSTTLSYSICNDNFSSLGIGAAVRASVFQFYFLCDRIPFSWKRAGIQPDSFVLPSNWSTLHARFGINLVFGNKEPD